MAKPQSDGESHRPRPPRWLVRGNFRIFASLVITTLVICGPGSVAGNKNSSIKQSTRLSLSMIVSTRYQVFNLLNSLLVSSFVRLSAVWAGAWWVKLQKKTRNQETKYKIPEAALQPAAVQKSQSAAQDIFPTPKYTPITRLKNARKAPVRTKLISSRANGNRKS